MFEGENVPQYYVPDAIRDLRVALRLYLEINASHRQCNVTPHLYLVMLVHRCYILFKILKLVCVKCVPLISNDSHFTVVIML